MNQTLSLVLNVVLAVAVAILYYLHFSGSSASSSASPATSSAPKGQAVVYIDLDSLLSNYTFFEELNKELQEKGTNAESQLIKKDRAFQTDVESFQKRFQAGLLSETEARRMQEQLAEKQKQLEMERQNLSAGLIESQRKIQEQLRDTLFSFLKQYNKDKGYQYIISKNGEILYGTPEFEITKEVLNGLNEKHKTSK